MQSDDPFTCRDIPGGEYNCSTLWYMDTSRQRPTFPKRLAEEARPPASPPRKAGSAGPPTDYPYEPGWTENNDYWEQVGSKSIVDRPDGGIWPGINTTRQSEAPVARPGRWEGSQHTPRGRGNSSDHGRKRIGNWTQPRAGNQFEPRAEIEGWNLCGANQTYEEFEQEQADEFRRLGKEREHLIRRQHQRK